jgi:hypothetical protein
MELNNKWQKALKITGDSESESKKLEINEL